MNPNLANQLHRAALVRPEAPALYQGTRQLATFAQLSERVSRCAQGLREGLGLAPGDRVALVMKNCPEYVELLYGIWHAGLCAVPINAKLHPREIDYILDNAGARACFIHGVDGIAPERAIRVDSPEYRALLDAPPAPVAPVNEGDLAWLFYTSGTTGQPKGVMLSHRNLTAMAWAFSSSVSPIAPGDSLIHVAPLSHGSGLYLIPHLADGACQVIPASGGFAAEELAQLIVAHRRPAFFAAPTILNRLVDYARRTQADLSNLKLIVCGGAPLYLEDELRALDCLGPKIAQIYGQGESPMTITAQSAGQIAQARAAGDLAGLGSVGQAFPGIELRLAGPDGRPVAAGESGEILVRGPTVMRGYWRNPTASAATLRDGWLHTGDVGCLDPQGRLTLMDRCKDVIISGGSNIYPREVEDALLSHPAIGEISVLGQPNPEWGEEVVAVVALRPGYQVEQEELDQWCQERIARFKRPRTYLFVDELPKNSTGKVLKTALRQRLAGLPG